jgi:hypothetical protein
LSLIVVGATILPCHRHSNLMKIESELPPSF